MECDGGEGKESAYPSYRELLLYAYTCTEMHRRIRKCASMFVHIRTTKHTDTAHTGQGNNESNWKVCGCANCTIFSSTFLRSLNN